MNEEVFSRQVERNLLGIELEKQDKTENAIHLYEENVKELFIGTHPYTRLAIIYRRIKSYSDEIRVLEKAIYVFENIVPKNRIGIVDVINSFKARLLKAQILLKPKE